RGLLGTLRRLSDALLSASRSPSAAVLATETIASRAACCASGVARSVASVRHAQALKTITADGAGVFNRCRWRFTTRLRLGDAHILLRLGHVHVLLRLGPAHILLL